MQVDEYVAHDVVADLPGHPIMVEGSRHGLRCGLCGSTGLAEDLRNGQLVCIECGTLVENQQLYALADGDGRPRGVLRFHDSLDAVPAVSADKQTAKSPPYVRCYHFAEHVASYRGRDPVIDMEILDDIYEGFLRFVTASNEARREEKKAWERECKSIEEKTAKQELKFGRALTRYVPEPPKEEGTTEQYCRELRLDQIKAICKDLHTKDRKKKFMKYYERFVQVKMHISKRVGVAMTPSYWLEPIHLRKLRRDFALLCMTFDQILYKPGKRRTVKDDEYDPEEEEGFEEQRCKRGLKRHNMVRSLQSCPI
jgi:hypothetical protein